MDTPMEAAITPLVVVHGNKNVHLERFNGPRKTTVSLAELDAARQQHSSTLSPFICAHLPPSSNLRSA